jgi:ABC-2 type transport system ATP-binding protein
MKKYCIETEDLVRHFGDKTAIDHLNLTIPSGGIHAIVGSNGAGKTTLFRLLIGIDTPSEGNALLLGTDSRALTPEIRARVGYVNEEHSLPTWMRVEAVKAMQESFYPDWNQKIYDEVIAWFDVDPAQKISALSRGERAGFNLSMALAQRPDLLILDEPTLGLDVVARQSFLEAVMFTERAENTTIIYCSHQMEEIERIADRLIILENGKLRNNSSPDEFCERVSYWTLEGNVDNKNIPGLLSRRVIDGRQHVMVVDQDGGFGEVLESSGANDVRQMSVNLERAVNAFLTANHKKPENVNASAGTA